jgi:hypothetical protein
MAFLLAPGNLICRLVGLDNAADNGQVLRMFVNTVFWSIVGIAAVLLAVL